MIKYKNYSTINRKVFSRHKELNMLQFLNIIINDKRREKMGKATLVIMAAGIGSRFGGGIKQLEPVGPNGEIIIDYSIYDAVEAGFDKVVFVIRKDLEKDFKKIIGDRIAEKVEVQYAYQELEDIPIQYQNKFVDRKKPWGTGQAVLRCKDLVNEPFLVINADDFYGKEAYRVAFEYLKTRRNLPSKKSICMVGFVLKNTLSNNGGVTRGICKVDKTDMLTNIVETHNIVKTDKGAAIEGENGLTPIDVEEKVSMNMWGFLPDFFTVLEKEFKNFLESLQCNDLSTEYLLPTIIGDLLKEDAVEVKVLHSTDRWFGVTYKADKEEVVKEIKRLIDSGVYK